MDYIIEFNPYIEKELDAEYYSNIEKNITAGRSITQNDAENFLRAVSYVIRKKINPRMDNYDYKCDLAQSILCHYLDKIGCQFSPCATHHVITEGVEGHSFTVVTLNVEGEDRHYIVDPTYIQFFHRDKCQESNFFVSPLLPDKTLLMPDPGFFIQEEDKEAANFLLRYGYIEMTSEYARMYGDSFYNTKPGINPKEFKPKTISGDIYMNAFLKGKEKLSKSEAELMFNGQNITPFQDLEKSSLKAI